MRTALICALVALCCIFAMAMPPVNLVANVRGKKYEISAESVEEFSLQVENLTGLESNQQSVLYKGKVLSATDNFEELGIRSGEVLNVVKGKRSRAANFGKEVSNSKKAKNNSEIDMLDDQSIMNEPMSADQMQQAKQAMEQMLDSDFIDEYFSDDEKLETARQQLLSNLDQYDKMMPGFREQAEEIASSPEKWREAMQKVKEQMLALKKQRDERGSSSLNPDSSSIDDITDEDED